MSNQILVLQSKLTNVPDDEIQLARLERDKATAEKLYTFFAEKLEETRVQEAGVTSDLRIINSPAVHDKPVNSRGRLRAGIIAVIIGMLAGVFAVFVVEYFDNKVKDPSLISEKLGIPVFASIPSLSAEDSTDKRVTPDAKRAVRKKSGDANACPVRNEISNGVIAPVRLGGSAAKQSQSFSDLIGQSSSFLYSLLTGAKPQNHVSVEIKLLDPLKYSAEFEAFRKLAISLEFAHPEKEYRVIYVTSSGPDAGKTFISLNLAHVLSYSNKKTIVIDTDFRKKRGGITDVVGMRKKPGLFDVLRGEIKLDGAIVRYSVPFNSSSQGKKDSDTPSLPNSVSILPVGKIPPNPFTFLDSDVMKRMITDLKAEYDYVIIDGVPLIIFADASYLANFADGVVLTARYDRTALKELEYSRDMLQQSKSNIIGIVMNGVPRTRDGYYYYHHYYYQKYYPKYYQKEDR